MSEFNWCHGPNCHEKHTVDRVRGVKGSKVLKTRKIKINNYNQGYWYSYFCSQHCYNDFTMKYIDRVIAIAPRTEALETPIEDPKKTTHTTSYGYNYTNTEIVEKQVDNNGPNSIG